MDCGAACKAGVEALYRANSAPLLLFVRQCGTERGLAEAQLDAEGVVHETFEQMLRDQGIISNPPAWLYTVARRRVAKLHAGQRRYAHGDPRHLIDGDSTDVRWTSLAPRAAADDIIAARAVMDAIAGLPDRQRTATYLRQVEGWSLNEIGSYLNCAAATASVHVHRGTRTVVRAYVKHFWAADNWTKEGADGPLAGWGWIAGIAAAALLLVMGLAAGLLYGLGAPLWAVLVGSLASVALLATGVGLFLLWLRWSW